MFQLLVGGVGVVTVKYLMRLLGMYFTECLLYHIYWALYVAFPAIFIEKCTILLNIWNVGILVSPLFLVFLHSVLSLYSWCLTCSSWLLRDRVGHLVFCQTRHSRGTRGPKAIFGSCGSIGWRPIQLCPGFGFWHGSVPGKIEADIIIYLFIYLHSNVYKE